MFLELPAAHIWMSYMRFPSYGILQAMCPSFPMPLSLVIAAMRRIDFFCTLSWVASIFTTQISGLWLTASVCRSFFMKVWAALSPPTGRRLWLVTEPPRGFLIAQQRDWLMSCCCPQCLHSHYLFCCISFYYTESRQSNLPSDSNRPETVLIMKLAVNTHTVGQII